MYLLPRRGRQSSSQPGWDDGPSPCFFNQTNPLRNEYAGLGVSFTGPNATGGGAILDECGNFGVSGYSAPNFLAFNCTASMANGGVPQGPETITFTPLVAAVSFTAGSGDKGATLTVHAYDVNNVLLDSDSIALAPNLQPLSVSGGGISYVVVGMEEPCIWVMDDLSTDQATPTEPRTWGSIKAAFGQ